MDGRLWIWENGGEAGEGRRLEDLLAHLLLVSCALACLFVLPLLLLLSLLLSSLLLLLSYSTETMEIKDIRDSCATRERGKGGKREMFGFSKQYLSCSLSIKSAQLPCPGASPFDLFFRPNPGLLRAQDIYTHPVSCLLSTLEGGPSKLPPKSLAVTSMQRERGPARPTHFHNLHTKQIQHDTFP